MFGFLEAADAIEQRAVAGLSLAPLELDPSLANVTGTWKDAAVRLEARAWSGPQVALFRTVRVTAAQLAIVNVVSFARPPIAAPILGVDLVGARPDAGLVVADLSPLDPPGASIPEIPAWAQPIFSASPIFERVTPDSAAALLPRVVQMLDRFIDTIHDEPDGDGADWCAAAIDRYLEAHHGDDRMRTMLGHMFGATTAQRLWDAVLFPKEWMRHVYA
jgi:hypothetical protein